MAVFTEGGSVDGMSFKNSDQSGSLFFIIKNMYIMVPDHYPDLAQSTAQK